MQSIVTILGRRGWRFWLGTVLSLASLTWLVVTTDWVEVWGALKTTTLWLLLLAAVMALISIPIRTFRWRFLFHAERRSPFGRMMAILLMGQAVNLLGPARLGEVMQAALVETAPGAYVVGTQVMRIILDLLMVAVLVVLLLFQTTLPDWWRNPGQALVLVAALALLVMVVLVAGRRSFLKLLGWLGQRVSHRLWQRILKMAADFVGALEGFARPATLGLAVLLTVLIWIIYAMVNNVLLGAVGEPFSWLAATFVLVVLTLGAAIPSSPGRVGVYHYLGVQSLAVFGIDQATAVTYTILLHLITVVMPIVLAVLLAWQLGISLKPASTGGKA